MPVSSTWCHFLPANYSLDKAGEQFTSGYAIIRSTNKQRTMSNLLPYVAINVEPHVALGIDLINLETFIAVVELGSFSQAAQRLHVTQPSVTGRIQRLESALGTQLLVRTTRKIELTPQGAALLAEAAGALHGIRMVAARFREDSGSARQRVTVASTPMLSAMTLPPLIRDYSIRFPDVRVTLLDVRYLEALAALESGRADLAVLAFEGKDTRFRIQPLGSEDVVLVTPADHPLAGKKVVTLDDLATHRLIFIEQYEPMRERIVEKLKLRGLTLSDPTIVGNLATLLGMLDAGLGATLLVKSMARRSKEAGHVIVEVDGLNFVRSFAIVRARKAQLGTAAESFSRFLRDAMS